MSECTHVFYFRLSVYFCFSILFSLLKNKAQNKGRVSGCFSLFSFVVVIRSVAPYIKVAVVEYSMGKYRFYFSDIPSSRACTPDDFTCSVTKVILIGHSEVVKCYTLLCNWSSNFTYAKTLYIDLHCVGKLLNFDILKLSLKQ